VFSLATEPVPGRPTEDFVLASTDVAVVVDGGGGEGGACTHGVPWFARQLGAHLLAALVDEPGLPLAEGLARAIRTVGRMHVYTCDLAAPGAPSAAVAVLRVDAAGVDVLALGGCLAVVETNGVPEVTGDPAPGRGVAAEPRDARHALTARFARDSGRVALLTGGAARMLASPDARGWAAALDLAEARGPAGLLRHLRAAAGEPADATLVIGRAGV